MSGRPNPHAVGDLRRAFRDVESARRSIAELNQKAKEVAQSLESNQEWQRNSEQEIKRLLTEMDVSSPGNAGWEGRYFELLLLMSN